MSVLRVTLQCFRCKGIAKCQHKQNIYYKKIRQYASN